jgi:hypothetical protein
VLDTLDLAPFDSTLGKGQLFASDKKYLSKKSLCPNPVTKNTYPKKGCVQIHAVSE